jgi:ribosomal protein L11 methyltransferase
VGRRANIALIFERRTPLWHRKSVPTWLQLSFKAPPEALDTVSNFLIERGSPGVVVEKNAVRAFFPLAHARAGLRRDVQNFHNALGHIYPSLGGQPLRWMLLKDKNWKNSWRRFFTKRAAPAGRHALTIEPGMAFGTGMHFTTRTCLEFIEQAAERLPARQYAALDLGTGSGILAIAIAKLRAKNVLALDLDPLAVKAAQANVRRNRVDKFVSVRRIGLEKTLAEPFDLIVANLTAETLIELARSLEAKAAPRGYLILSGILRPKTKDVARKFARATVVAKKNDREWSTLLLQKKD